MGGEDADKIIRIPGETLLVKLTPEEVTYRSKYLPDPKKLTDEKLVCTVCSVSLATNVHRGKDIFVHRALHVLVCEVCYNFYGDGCFSADEDGDDKYCRWCGQGGTLYLCSSCTCAFCQKCVKQNLKASVLAELDNDDWKCYICNPRPLFGCRTICWGAEELNKIGKAKELEKLKKQQEKLQKLAEKKKEAKDNRFRKMSTSEDELTTKKRKTRDYDSDSSSPEVMPTKRPKRAATDTGNLNVSTSKTRRKKKDSSSDETSEDEKKVTRRSRSTNKKSKKPVDSSSEDDSDFKAKTKTKSKKKTKESSDESSEKEKKKSKRKSVKNKVDSSDGKSSDERHARKKRLVKKHKEDISDSSTDEKQKKKKLKKKKKETSSEESSNDDNKKSRKIVKKKKEESSGDDTDYVKKNMQKIQVKKGLSVITRKISENPDSDNESKKGKNDDADESVINGKTGEAKSKVNSKDGFALVDNVIIKKRIKLAVLWLNNAVKDISELGNLISVRATKFGKKKINAENLKSYEDVLSTVSKLKQLISGVHSNYEHIEKSLDAHLKPWRILTGLEEPENEKSLEVNVSTVNETVLKVDDSAVVDPESNDEKKFITDVNDSGIAPEIKSDVNMEVEDANKSNEPVKSETDADISVQWGELSPDDDSDNEDLNSTKKLISKANDILDQVEKEEEKQKSDNTNSLINSSETKENDIPRDSDETDLESSSQEKNHTTNSTSVNNSFDGDLKNSQCDSDEGHADERNRDRRKMSSKKDNKVQDAEKKPENSSDKSPKRIAEKSSHIDREVKISSIKEVTQLNNIVKKDGGENSANDDPKKSENNDLPTKGNPRKTSKKIDSTGQ